MQEYRTLQRKKMDERPYLDTHVIRESEHYYSLKAEEAGSSSSSSLTGKPVKNVQQNIKELQVPSRSCGRRSSFCCAVYFAAMQGV